MHSQRLAGCASHADASLAPALWAATQVTWVLLSVVALAYGATDVEGPSAHAGWALGAALERWTLWDGRYFIFIGTDGYTGLNEAAFYPLYPLLIRAGLFVAHLFGVAVSGQFVALTIAHLAALVFLVGLAVLAAADARRDGLPEAARSQVVRASLLALLAYPVAFFLLAAYSEAIFLAAAVWAAYAARQGRWWLAGGCAVLAGLARPTATPLALLLICEYAAQHRYLLAALRRRLRHAWTATAHAVLSCAGLALAPVIGMYAFALYCGARFGTTSAPVTAERIDFGRVLAWPWTGLGLAWHQWAELPPLSYMQLRWLTDLAPLVVVAALTLALLLAPAAMRLRRRHALRWPLSYTLYLVGTLLLILSTPVTMAFFPDAYAGASRFVLGAFPLFLLAGRALCRWPTLGHTLLVASVVAQVLLAAYVLRGGWLI